MSGRRRSRMHKLPELCLEEDSWCFGPGDEDWGANACALGTPFVLYISSSMINLKASVVSKSRSLQASVFSEWVKAKVPPSRNPAHSDTGQHNVWSLDDQRQHGLGTGTAYGDKPGRSYKLGTAKDDQIAFV